MNMNQHPKLLSNLFPSKTTSTIVEVSFLFLAGIFAAWAQYAAKVPLQLPGKQGLIFMFIIASLASVSGIRFSSSIAVSGAALFMFLVPGPNPDPFKPFIILLTGAFLDAMLYNAKAKMRIPILFIAIAGSLSWALIPVSRIIITYFTGIFYKSFATGFVYPLLAHMMFGFAGALLAAIIFRKVKL